jgi:outer membrane lipoprotein-sorting protein
MTLHDPQDDLLERATRLMREAPPLGDFPAGDVLQKIAASRDAASRQPIWIIQRIKSMKTLSKIAASILIGLALAGTGWVLLHASPALAFASVVQQLHDAQTMKADLIMQQEGMTLNAKILYMAPGRLRFELGNGLTEILDAQSGRIVVLDDGHKSATVLKVDPKNAQANSAAASVDWIEKLRNISHNAGKALGEAEVDGVRANQFNVRENGQQLTIFADARSGAPLRIETNVKLGDQSVVMTLDRIALGEPMDLSLFSTQIPSGYTQRETSLSGAPVGEADVAAFLTDYVDHNGVFPPSLRDFKKNKGIGAGTLSKDAKGPSPEFMKAVNQATRALVFVNQLPATADWHYAGDGVKKGDATRPVFWYHAKDASSYRVIYADLHVADVPAGDVPQTAAEKQSN